MHHPGSALRVPTHRLQTQRSVCPLAIAFGRRIDTPSRQAPRKVKTSPPMGSSRPQNRLCRLSNCRNHNFRHPRQPWGRNCMQPDRCNQDKWFRRLHKCHTHPTRCLHNRRTDLRCQARHRRHTRPPHCPRITEWGLNARSSANPTLIQSSQLPSSTIASHWDRNQGRSFHHPRTHHIRSKTHRPPQPLSQNCTQQGRYTLPIEPSPPHTPHSSSTLPSQSQNGSTIPGPPQMPHSSISVALAIAGRSHNAWSAAYAALV